MRLLCIKKIASAAGLTLLILLCLPAAVAAHPMKGVGDFYSGMLHPLTALEFLLSWVALAMFAGQQGRKTALLTLAIFPSALVLGASLGTVVPSPAWLPAMNLVLIPILGLAVVLAISFPSPATVILSPWSDSCMAWQTALRLQLRSRLGGSFPAWQQSQS
jgi:hydrogenase/urease accessory protein HupE